MHICHSVDHRRVMKWLGGALCKIVIAHHIIFVILNDSCLVIRHFLLLACKHHCFVRDVAWRRRNLLGSTAYAGVYLVLWHPGLWVRRNIKLLRLRVGHRIKMCGLSNVDIIKHACFLIVLQLIYQVLFLGCLIATCYRCRLLFLRTSDYKLTDLLISFGRIWRAVWKHLFILVVFQI